MYDRVAEVLDERASMQRGLGAAVTLSLVLHGGLAALGLYAAVRAPARQEPRMVKIQFAGIRAPAQAARRESRPVARPAARTESKIAEPKPRIEEPKPRAAKTPAKPEKGTVPLSPFGRSSKKGSESPAVEPPAQAPAAPAIGTAAADVPVGGTGISGLEGGDFPYTLYIEGMQRRIGSNWFRPQVAPGTAAVIYFRVQRNGTISEAEIETPSGNRAFDRAALSAVRSASPLTPLPYGYAGTWLGVHLTFR